MAEDKWWLAPTLTNSDRQALTEEQRAERRLMVLDARLANRRDDLTDIRRRRMSRIMRNWFHGEVLHEIAETQSEAEQGFRGMKAWLRGQFIAAITSASKGHDERSLIEDTIRCEVGKYMKTKGYTPNDERFTAFVHKVIEDEVRKQIAGSVTISSTIKGTVHAPIAGSRAIDLREDIE